jgi:hypothetical protein
VCSKWPCEKDLISAGYVSCNMLQLGG